MANFDIYAQFLKSWEAGYSYVKGDRGGKTYKGVTSATWADYCKRRNLYGYSAQLKNMTDAQWTDIMKGGYWDACWCDLIHSQGVANIMADWSINSGPALVIRKVQTIIGKGLKVDGKMGPNTLSAINAMTPGVLFIHIRNKRKEYYENLAKKDKTQAKFLKGWLRRNNAMRLNSFILNDKNDTEKTF